MNLSHLMESVKGFTYLQHLPPLALSYLCNENEIKGTIALIPGFMQTPVLYKNWVDRLNKAGFHVILIALDYRKERISLSQQAEGVFQSIKNISNVTYPLIVTGFSYGGAVSLQLATMYPELVHALLLLAPGGVDSTNKVFQSVLNNLAAFMHYTTGNHIWNTTKSFAGYTFPQNELALVQSRIGVNVIVGEFDGFHPPNSKIWKNETVIKDTDHGSLPFTLCNSDVYFKNVVDKYIRLASTYNSKDIVKVKSKL